MIEIRGRGEEIGEGPREVTVKNVQFWCKHARELEKSQSSKARKFVEFDCIKYMGMDGEFGSRHAFVCLPLNTADTWDVYVDEHEVRDYNKKPYPTDYNNSEYKIFKNKDGRFECNCQGWHHKEKRGEGRSDGVNCSHVLALFFCFKMKKFGKHQGNTDDLAKIDPMEGRT